MRMLAANTRMMISFDSFSFFLYILIFSLFDTLNCYWLIKWIWNLIYLFERQIKWKMWTSETRNWGKIQFNVNIHAEKARIISFMQSLKQNDELFLFWFCILMEPFLILQFDTPSSFSAFKIWIFNVTEIATNSNREVLR